MVQFHSYRLPRLLFVCLSHVVVVVVLFLFFFHFFFGEFFSVVFCYCATLLFFRTLLASQCRKIKRKSRYQGTRFALRIKIIHLCGLFAKRAQKFYCLTQRHRWRPRVLCLWGDRDDHMGTTNRPSRPDHLEIFWNDWGDRDDPDDHPGLNWGNFGNFALRASENVVNFFSLKGRATKPKLSLWSEVNAIGNSKDLLSKLCVLNGQNWQTISRSRDTAKMLELTATTSGLCKLCAERLSWLPVDVFLAAVQVCLRSLILSTLNSSRMTFRNLSVVMNKQYYKRLINLYAILYVFFHNSPLILSPGLNDFCHYVTQRYNHWIPSLFITFWFSGQNAIIFSREGLV